MGQLELEAGASRYNQLCRAARLGKAPEPSQSLRITPQHSGTNRDEWILLDANLSSTLRSYRNIIR